MSFILSTHRLIFKKTICIISAVVICLFYLVNKAVLHVVLRLIWKRHSHQPACSWVYRWAGWWRCCSWPDARAPRWRRGWWCWAARTSPSWRRRRTASSTTGSKLPWSEPWTGCGTLASERLSFGSFPPVEDGTRGQTGHTDIESRNKSKKQFWCDSKQNWNGYTFGPFISNHRVWCAHKN